MGPRSAYRDWIATHPVVQLLNEMAHVPSLLVALELGCGHRSQALEPVVAELDVATATEVAQAQGDVAVSR